MGKGKEEVQVSYELLGILITVIGQGLFVAYKLGRLEEKLVTLEKKQDKHNAVIDRTRQNEIAIGILQEQIKVENHRIEDLEGVQHECIRQRD